MSKLTVPSFRSRKKKLGGEPLVVLTAYDAATTAVGEAGGVDALLVGDSLGMVVLGYESTLPVTLEDVLHHARAVGRVRGKTLLIADMPWLSYHLSPEDAVRNAARFVREAGADAVKIEGGRNRLPVLHALRDAEIPVMGHLGLTPQSVLRMGGYRVQGRGEEAAKALLEDARALEDGGAFSLVLEGIPAALASAITEAVGIPTIGIGAGPQCDGQVLVVHDLLGMLPGSVPKFVRRYDSSHERQSEAVRRWAEDVRAGRFPSESEVYG